MGKAKCWNVGNRSAACWKYWTQRVFRLRIICCEKSTRRRIGDGWFDRAAQDNGGSKRKCGLPLISWVDAVLFHGMLLFPPSLYGRHGEPEFYVDSGGCGKRGLPLAQSGFQRRHAHQGRCQHEKADKGGHSCGLPTLRAGTDLQSNTHGETHDKKPFEDEKPPPAPSKKRRDTPPERSCPAGKRRKSALASFLEIEIVVADSACKTPPCLQEGF